MTASISPCWRNPPDLPRSRSIGIGGNWLRFVFSLLLSCLLLGLLPEAQAAGRGMSFRYHEIVPVEQHYVVNASVELQPNPRLQELVDGGLSIPFVAEFTITRSRWYWLDETVVERNTSFRLFYHALTRQYRLSIGGIHRNFSSFDDALRAMLTLRNWAVAEHGNLTDGETYNASLRFRLDTAQLPKPFQVAALGSRDLDLTTNWVHWNFVAQALDPR
jgi:hypothetical protein